MHLWLCLSSMQCDARLHTQLFSLLSFKQNNFRLKMASAERTLSMPFHRKMFSLVFPIALIRILQLNYKRLCTTIASTESIEIGRKKIENKNERNRRENSHRSEINAYNRTKSMLKVIIDLNLICVRNVRMKNSNKSERNEEGNFCRLRICILKDLINRLIT